MRRGMGIVVASLWALWVGLAPAGELAFPQTEAEIVEALSLTDGRTTYQGREYVSEGGKVYEIIGGKRYMVRGLEAIVDSDLAPRAGALIHFGFDSSRIRPESYPLLDEFGKALKGGLAGAVILVAGHTDSTGTERYNQGLSERRAEAVVGYLTARHGIKPDRLPVKAYGESRPIASNTTQEGQALNRRVEFVRVGGF